MHKEIDRRLKPFLEHDEHECEGENNGTRSCCSFAALEYLDGMAKTCDEKKAAALEQLDRISKNCDEKRKEAWKLFNDEMSALVWKRFLNPNFVGLVNGW